MISKINRRRQKRKWIVSFEKLDYIGMTKELELDSYLSNSCFETKISANFITEKKNLMKRG